MGDRVYRCFDPGDSVLQPDALLALADDLPPLTVSAIAAIVRANIQAAARMDRPAAPPAGTVPVRVVGEKRIEAERVSLCYAIEGVLLGLGASSRKVHELADAIQNMIRAYLPEREVEARGEKDA